MRTRLWCGLLLVLLAMAAFPGAAGAAGDARRLLVPHRSQFDGDPYAAGNCGPATMAMVLGAYGKPVPTAELRALVNDLQGTWGEYDAGTFIENLAVVAERYGLRPTGLFADPSPTRRRPPGKNALRRWTLDELRRQLDAGYPVVPQVWFPALPGREQAAYRGDHFIVITGYEGDQFVYNDSVDKDGPGADRRVSASQLEKAWRSSDYPYAALAVVGPDGRPAPTPTPPATATPLPTRPPAPEALHPVATATPSPVPTTPPTATPTTSAPAAAVLEPTATAAPPSPTAAPPAATVAPTPSADRSAPKGQRAPEVLAGGAALALLVAGVALAVPRRSSRRRRG